MKTLGTHSGYSPAYHELRCRIAYLEGYIQGLKESHEIAKDYTGQGVAIAARISDRITKANAR